MPDSNQTPNTTRFQLSLDTWAVAVAALFALLVRTGVLKHVPW